MFRTRAILIKTCTDCPYKGTRPSAVPGSTQPVCHHPETIKQYLSGRHLPRDEEKIPSWCKLVVLQEITDI